MQFTTFLTSILSVFALATVHAKPVAIETRDLFVPPLLYPHEGTVWIVGQHHNVTWDISNPPVNITDRIGSIQLVDNSLITPCILTQGFDLLVGRVEVTVPTVLPGDNYQLVLFGDSGNFGPVFTITD